MYLAEHEGIFESEGVDVELVTYPSLTDLRYAFQRGEIDGMACTLTDVIQVRAESDRSPQIFLVADYSNGLDAVIARREIRSMADLRGRIIASEPGALGAYFLSRALEVNNLARTEVVTQAYEADELKNALIAGIVDAVCLYPPDSTTVLQDPAFHTIFDSSAIPGEIIDCITLDASVLERNPKSAARIMIAWDRALLSYRSRPRTVVKYLSERTGLTSQEFADALHAVDIIDLRGQANYVGASGRLHQHAENAVRILNKYGHIVDALNVSDISTDVPLKLASKTRSR